MVRAVLAVVVGVLCAAGTLAESDFKARREQNRVNRARRVAAPAPESLEALTLDKTMKRVLEMKTNSTELFLPTINELLKSTLEKIPVEDAQYVDYVFEQMPMLKAFKSYNTTYYNPDGTARTDVTDQQKVDAFKGVLVESTEMIESLMGQNLESGTFQNKFQEFLNKPEVKEIMPVMTEGNKEGIDQISEMFFNDVLMDGKGTVDYNALKDSQWIRDSQAEMAEGNLAFMNAIIKDPTAMGILTDPTLSLEGFNPLASYEGDHAEL